MPYTNVVLAIGDDPFCHGLLIDKVVLTVAHCLRRRPKFNILFAAQGALNRVEVSEQAFAFPSSHGGYSIDTDLAAIRIEQAINPNADGIANLDESLAGRRFGHAENAYLEQGYGPFRGKAGGLLIQRRILNLMYMSASQSHRKYALRVPAPESRNTAIDEDGMLVLAPSDKPIVPEYNLVCQGDSGSAVMAEINSAKYLVGFASGGDFTFQTETRSCGNTLWVSRLDNGGMTWIRGLLGKSPDEAVRRSRVMARAFGIWLRAVQRIWAAHPLQPPLSEFVRHFLSRQDGAEEANEGTDDLATALALSFRRFESLA